MGQCAAIVYDSTGFHRHQCARTGTVIRVGKDGREFEFCRQHDPLEKARRERERREKWEQAHQKDTDTESRLRALVTRIGAGRPIYMPGIGSQRGHWLDGIFFSTSEVEDLLSRMDTPGAPPYDKDFGDDRLCVCGHPYYRHFDTYEAMRPVGCKYWSACHCEGFKAIDKE